MECSCCIYRWGKNKLDGDDTTNPDRLKKVLTKLLPLVRYTNITPNECTSAVVPLNLLSEPEIISVYAYFGSGEDNR